MALRINVIDDGTIESRDYIPFIQRNDDDSWQEWPGGVALENLPLVRCDQADHYSGNVYRISFGSRLNTVNGDLFNSIGQAFYQHGPSVLIPYLKRAQALGCTHLAILAPTGRHLDDSWPNDRRAMAQVPVRQLDRHDIMKWYAFHDLAAQYNLKLSVYLGVCWMVQGVGYTVNHWAEFTKMIQYIQTTMRINHVFLDEWNHLWSRNDKSPRNTDRDPITVPPVYDEDLQTVKQKGIAMELTVKLRKLFPDMTFIAEGHPPQTRSAMLMFTAGMGTPYDWDTRRLHWSKWPKRVHDLRYIGTKRYMLISGNGVWPDEDFYGAIEFCAQNGYNWMVDFNQDPEKPQWKSTDRVLAKAARLVSRVTRRTGQSPTQSAVSAEEKGSVLAAALKQSRVISVQ